MNSTFSGKTKMNSYITCNLSIGDTSKAVSSIQSFSNYWVNKNYVQVPIVQRYMSNIYGLE